jgi:very-short-patch-repair endonuclease
MSLHTPSKLALALHSALIKEGIAASLECFDHHKSVDICIPEARLNIEIDGLQHFVNSAIIESDFKRDHYSDLQGIATLRVPNYVADEHLEEIVRAIKKVVLHRKTS